MPGQDDDLDPEKYWVALHNWKHLPKGQRPRKRHKKTELLLLVHDWFEAREETVTATLKLFECDTQEKDRDDAHAAEDVQFAEMELTLKPNPNYVEGEDTERPQRVVASVARRKDVLDKKYQPYRVKKSRHADFVLRIGDQIFPFKIPKTDLVAEARDGTAEIGFVLVQNEGQQDVRSYEVLPPLAPAPIPLVDPLKKMLGLKNRFSDPKRRPSLSAKEAPTKLEQQTLTLLQAEAKQTDPTNVDLDLDGLRFDLFLKEGTSRKEFIEKIIATNNPHSMLGKTTALFTGMKYDTPALYKKVAPKKKGDKPIYQLGKKGSPVAVVDDHWTGATSNLTKAFFVIHDVGIQVDRARRHYQANRMGFRWKEKKKNKSKSDPKPVPRWVARQVHGFINWGGVYCPINGFEDKKHGTMGIGGRYRDYALAFENVPLMYYRKAKKDDLVELLQDPSAQVDTYPDALFPTRDHAGVKFACMGWKHPLTSGNVLAKAKAYWPDKAKKNTNKLPSGETRYLVNGWTQPLIETLADLYLLGSARAGHLLTVTCHVETDRSGKGTHHDPVGLVLEAFYDAVTDRLNGGPDAEVEKRRKQQVAFSAEEQEVRKTYYTTMHGTGGYKRYLKKHDDDKEAENAPYLLRQPLPLAGVKLPGGGRLKIPKGTRYGMHPRRLTDAPVDWFGVPLARTYGHASTYKWSFPHQSGSDGKLK